VESLSSNLLYRVAYSPVFMLRIVRSFVLAVILLSAPDDFMWIGQQASKSFTSDRTYKYEFRLERLRWIALDVILEVDF